MDGGALGQPPGSVSKRDLAAQRDDIQTRIARAIIVPADELVPIRSPIVILQVWSCGGNVPARQDALMPGSQNAFRISVERALHCELA